MSDPDPVSSTVDQKKGDGVVTVGGVGCVAGAGGAREARVGGKLAAPDGGIQDEADPIWGPIPSPPSVPVELTLDAKETTPMRLQALEEGHRISTSS